MKRILFSCAALALTVSLCSCGVFEKESKATDEPSKDFVSSDAVAAAQSDEPMFDLSDDDPSFSGELADPEQSEATNAVKDLLNQLEEDEEVTEPVEEPVITEDVSEEEVSVEVEDTVELPNTGIFLEDD